MLVKIPRVSDSDECGTLHLSQSAKDCNTLTSIDLNRLGKLATYDPSITSEETEGIRKTRTWVKRKLIDSKVKVAVTCGAMNVLLSVFLRYL